MKVHYLPGSHSILPALTLLTQTQEPHERVPVNLMSGRATIQPDEYPRLDDCDVSIVGGTSIALYLCRKFAWDAWNTDADQPGVKGSGARSSALIHAACSRIDRISAHLSVLVQILTIGRPLHIVSGSHALIRLAKQMSAQTNSNGGSTDENDAADFAASPHASLLVHHSACLRDELSHWERHIRSASKPTLSAPADDETSNAPNSADPSPKQQQKPASLREAKARLAAENANALAAAANGTGLVGGRRSVADVVLICALLPLNMLAADRWLRHCPLLCVWVAAVATSIGPAFFDECAGHGVKTGQNGAQVLAPLSHPMMVGTPPASAVIAAAAAVAASPTNAADTAASSASFSNTTEALPTIAEGDHAEDATATASASSASPVAPSLSQQLSVAHSSGVAPTDGQWRALIANRDAATDAAFVSLPAPPHAALPEQFAKLDTLKWLAHRAFANVRQAFRDIQSVDSSLGTTSFSRGVSWSVTAREQPAYLETDTTEPVAAADAITSQAWVRVVTHNMHEGIVVLAKSLEPAPPSLVLSPSGSANSAAVAASTAAAAAGVSTLMGSPTGAGGGGLGMSGSFPAASAGSGRGHCVYATGEVRAPASFVLDIIKQRRDKYDPCFNGVQSLEQVAADMNILYNRSIVREVNQEMIRTARFEFCLLTAEMTDEADGSIWLCSNSVEHSGAPKGSGFVRAEQPFAGWRLTPHPADLFCCRIELVTAFRSTGRLPSWVAPLHVAHFAEFIERIRTLCANGD